MISQIRKNPSRARAGAQDRKAGATENPYKLNSRYPSQSQFLIAAHHACLELTVMSAFGMGEAKVIEPTDTSQRSPSGKIAAVLDLTDRRAAL